MFMYCQYEGLVRKSLGHVRKFVLVGFVGSGVQIFWGVAGH